MTGGAVILILVAIAGAYLGALADRFSYWFHVSRVMLWRKHCPKCFSVQRWHTYLPIFGFIFRRGVCISCRAQLPIAAVCAEVVGAAALLYGYYVTVGQQIPANVFEWIHVALVAGIVFGMIVLAISDLVYDEVPFAAFLLTLVAIILNLFFYSDLANFSYSIFAGILGGFFMSVLVIVSRWRWVHAHDILFGILVGLLVGWQAMFITFAVAYIFAIIGGLASWGWGVRALKGTSSYGFYLFAALGVQAALQLVSRSV